jgi:hypothetical protein
MKRKVQVFGYLATSYMLVALAACAAASAPLPTSDYRRVAPLPHDVMSDGVRHVSTSNQGS